MASNSSNHIADIFARDEKTLLDDWLREQLAALSARKDLISASELRTQSSEFLALITPACAGGNLTNITAPEWKAALNFLAEVSRGREAQGFSPSETATFVFSLKQPLFTRLRQALGEDAGARADELWSATLLIDKLGLYTTEVFQLSRETVIKRQQMELQTALESLQQREAELSKINTELTKTNSGVVALYVDVKDKAQQLAQANQALEIFNYSVAHDLRAPLRGIDGWSLALLEDYADRLDDEGRQYLQRIRRDAQRMNQLIDDMLRLSNISLSAIHIEMIDLSAMANKLIERLQTAAPERQITCTIQPHLQVLGDQHLLQIALTNLLDNAWKFTSKNPHASIEVGCLPLTAPTDAPVFFVRDNGVGFDMQYAQKLFTPFQRMHTQQDFPGNGIGLATVQRILQRHGGRAWAEAEINKGATFYFQLPPHVSSPATPDNGG